MVIMQDCGLAGGTTYVTRDGGVGCAPAPMVTLPTNSGYQTTPPGFEGEDSPRPPFVNGEPQYQPRMMHGWRTAIWPQGLPTSPPMVCFGCVVAHGLEVSGEELVSSSQLAIVIPQAELAS